MPLPQNFITRSLIVVLLLLFFTIEGIVSCSLIYTVIILLNSKYFFLLLHRLQNSNRDFSIRIINHIHINFWFKASGHAKGGKQLWENTRFTMPVGRPLSVLSTNMIQPFSYFCSPYLWRRNIFYHYLITIPPHLVF